MAATCVPLLYIVHLNRGTWRALGLVRPSLMDIPLAIAVFVGSFIAAYVVAYAIYGSEASYSQGTSSRIDHIFPATH